MTSDNWKDALANLRGSLSPEEEGETTEDNTRNISAHNSEGQNLDSDLESQKTPLTIVIDKKGRNGKVATIIEGFTIPQDSVEDIARKLKQKLGVGGSVREGEILIQGDHKTAVKKFLDSLNLKSK